MKLPPPRNLASPSTPPPDGYYIASVLRVSDGIPCGTYIEHVRVSGGKCFLRRGDKEVALNLCSDFSELSTGNMVASWPHLAAIELESIRSEVARLRQWISDLEVVDQNPGPHRKWADVRHWIPSGCQIFLGDPPPRHLTPAQPDPDSRPS